MGDDPSQLADIRRRFLEEGGQALSDPEVVALVVGNGPGRRPANPLRTACAALERSGGLSGLGRCEEQDLAELRGVGPARALLLKAAVELGRRATVAAPDPRRALSSAAEVAAWFRSRLQDQERECIYALLLDNRNRPLRSLRVTEGAWTSCPVDPKVVLATCLRAGAPAFILVHNHPSGDPEPSHDDFKLTERMARAARVVGLRMLDHLIVGREGWTSLADARLLP